MSKIDLPHYQSLVIKHEGRFVANTYSGSLGTHADQGCVRARTFNYRVYVDISSGEESNFRLIAECWIIQPWSCGGEKTDMERAEFEGSDQGVTDAIDWLTQAAAKHEF